MSEVKLEPGWNSVLKDEFNKPYFLGIQYVLSDTKSTYPEDSLIFNAFKITPWDEVKVVILGQDPYHNAGQAMGLSFSVPKGVSVPPSLRNIYKELKEDQGCDIPGHGDLTYWATQGVLLLNAMLSVQAGKPGSHRKSGWQQFTDEIISQLSLRKEGLVFMLWGNFAMSKASLIDDRKHLVLKAAHPSPMARGAYFGSKHFSQANNYLASKGITGIDWQIK